MDEHGDPPGAGAGVVLASRGSHYVGGGLPEVPEEEGVRGAKISGGCSGS